MFTVLVHVWEVINEMVWEPLPFIIFASQKPSAYFFASQLTSVCILGVSFGLGFRHIPDLSSTCSWNQYGHAPSKKLLSVREEPGAQTQQRAWPRRASCDFSNAACMPVAETCLRCGEMPDKPKLSDVARNKWSAIFWNVKSKKLKERGWKGSMRKENQGICWLSAMYDPELGKINYKQHC